MIFLVWSLFRICMLVNFICGYSAFFAFVVHFDYAYDVSIWLWLYFFSSEGKSKHCNLFFFNRIHSVKVPELHQIQHQEVLHMDLRRENDINTARVCWFDMRERSKSPGNSTLHKKWSFSLRIWSHLLKKP